MAAEQDATLYKANGEVMNLSRKSWDTTPGWQVMRELIGCSTIEPHLLLLRGRWIKFILDEDGKMKEGRVNLKATGLWYEAWGIPIEEFPNRDFLVGDVIVLTFDRKPRG